MAPETTTDSFHDFERAGWERAAEYYSDAFGSLTEQTVGPLLKAAGVTSGARVLDVATGPGSVAAAAAALGARPVGIDFSPQMVALAREQHPSLVFEELGRHDAADRVAAVILGAGLAGTVAEEPGQRVRPTRLELATENVTVGHVTEYPSRHQGFAGPLFLPAALREVARLADDECAADSC